MSTQSLAARQAYEALLRVARARLRDLEAALERAQTKIETDTLRSAIAQTRNAIKLAEVIG